MRDETARLHEKRDLVARRDAEELRRLEENALGFPWRRWAERLLPVAGLVVLVRLVENGALW